MPPSHLAEVLPTGAEIRSTGAPGSFAVVCANGGRAAEVPGTWSASIEWLVRGLAPRFPELRFVELRYRVRSWKRLDLCVEDALAAVDAAGAERTLLMGFSMGGAVAVRAASHPSVVSAFSALRPGCPTSSTFPLSADDGSTSSTARSTAGCRDPRCQPFALAPRLRASEEARDRRLVHAHLRRGACDRAAEPVGGLVPLPRAPRWAELTAARIAAVRDRAT
jgi:pimeloyl-ACP methyl ester carboxylesterase